MTWINLKQIDAQVEARILALIVPACGMRITELYGYFSVGSVGWSGSQQRVLKSEIPGWFCMSVRKRGARLNKIIQRLILDGRAKIEVDEILTERLVPPNVLDRIVFSLDQLPEE